MMAKNPLSIIEEYVQTMRRLEARYDEAHELQVRQNELLEEIRDLLKARAHDEEGSDAEPS